jgi:hypothetical protein
MSMTDDPTVAKSATADDEPYLIWSNEHRRWWGPGERGYVFAVSKAGRYRRDHAIQICRNALGTAGHLGLLAELPVRLRDVQDFLDGQLIPAGLA